MVVNGEVETRGARFIRIAKLGGLTKWVAAAAVGALIAGLVGDQISDRYADKQRELELEGDLITQISHASIALIQNAQEASRANDNPRQRPMRDLAADEWVLESGSITPIMNVYYPRSQVLENWNDFQQAMYDWAVLGCCTDDRRANNVQGIRDYLDKHVGAPNSNAPVSDPWTALAADDTPEQDLYQWVGFELLRGRGSLLADLREVEPVLD